MKKFQLNIQEPCHENWNNMSPSQQGRYCSACSKEVIDFSECSDAELLNFFSRSKGQVCGRLYSDQLNRVIAPKPKKKLFWYLNYVWALVFFAAKPGLAQAQQKAKAGQTVVPHKKPKIPKLVGFVAMSNQSTFSGIVKDEAGNPLPAASIQAMGTTAGTVADSAGRFTITLDNDNGYLQISAIGYQPVSIPVSGQQPAEIVLQKRGELLREVELRSGSIQYNRRIAGGISVISCRRSFDIIPDTIKNIFKPVMKLYPDPVKPGSNLNIELKLPQSGRYSILVTDATGSVLETTQLQAPGKMYQFQLPVKQWPTAMYFIKLIDSKGNLVGTGRFLVQ